MHVRKGSSELSHPFFRCCRLYRKLTTPHVLHGFARNKFKNPERDLLSIDFGLSRGFELWDARVIDEASQSQFFQFSIRLSLIGLNQSRVEQFQKAKAAIFIKNTVRFCVPRILDGEQHLVLLTDDFSFGKLHHMGIGGTVPSVFVRSTRAFNADA